jgi:diaminopimelate decarboxylase
VSDFEYEKARNLGIPGSQIIFNGPHKSREALIRAVDEKALLQVDHFDELAELQSLSLDRAKPIRIALRISLDAGIRPVWSKFGFCLENGEALRAIRAIANTEGRIELVGLHCHIGTYILSPEAYAAAIAKLADLALEAEAFGFNMEYFNLGGGLPSSSTLHGAAFPASQTNPPVEAYARAIGDAMNRESCRLRRKPRLFLESGRALIDESGYLLSTVVANKITPRETYPPALAADPKSLGPIPVSSGETSMIIDAGVHLLYTGNWYRFQIDPGREVGGPDIPTKLFGCLCMNIDVIREEVPLPPLRPGDPLVIHPVGAYNVTQSMQFIAYRPRVVMIAEGGTDHVIREKENLEAVEGMERLPDHLQTSELAVPILNAVT